MGVILIKPSIEPLDDVIRKKKRALSFLNNHITGFPLKFMVAANRLRKDGFPADVLDMEALNINCSEAKKIIEKAEPGLIIVEIGNDESLPELDFAAELKKSINMPTFITGDFPIENTVFCLKNYNFDGVLLSGRGIAFEVDSSSEIIIETEKFSKSIKGLAEAMINRKSLESVPDIALNFDGRIVLTGKSFHEDDAYIFAGLSQNRDVFEFIVETGMPAVYGNDTSVPFPSLYLPMLDSLDLNENIENVHSKLPYVNGLFFGKISERFEYNGKIKKSLTSLKSKRTKRTSSLPEWSVRLELPAEKEKVPLVINSGVYGLDLVYKTEENGVKGLYELLSFAKYSRDLSESVNIHVEIIIQQGFQPTEKEVSDWITSLGSCDIDSLSCMPEKTGKGLNKVSGRDLNLCLKIKRAFENRPGKAKRIFEGIFGRKRI